MREISAISIAVILLSCLALVFGYFGYPPAGNNDGAWYIVPAIRMAQVHILDNPIVWTGDLIVGHGPFLAFPPFFELFLSRLISPNLSIPLPLQAFIVIGAINVVVIALSAWALYMVATLKWKRLTWPATIMICILLFLIFRFSWSFNGRPEVFVRLFFTLGLVSVLRMRSSSRLAITLGILLGLMSAAHPLAPVLFVALTICFFAWQYDLLKSIKYLVLTAFMGLLIFYVAMQFSPYSISATLAGVYRHGALMVSRVSSGSTMAALLKNFYVVIFFLLGAMLMVFGTRRFLKLLKEKKIASPTLFIFGILLVAAYGVFVVLNNRNYYITPFLLLVLVALLYYVIHVQSSKYIKGALIFLCAIIAIVSLKHVTLFPFFMRSGMTLPEARAAFAEILILVPPDIPIVLGGSQTWAFSEEYDRMIPSEPISGSGTSEYLFLLQEEGDTSRGPQTRGPKNPDACVVVGDFYLFEIPKIFGIPIARVVPGYNFAVYDCQTGF